MRNLIDEIKARLTIDDIIKKLAIEVDRKAKGGYFIKSIYRNEKTASMMIYVNENRFVDFGNDEMGDQIQLYQDYYGLDIKTAIEDLKKIAGLDNPYVSPGPKREPAIDKKPAENPIEKALQDCSTDERYFFDELAGTYNDDNKALDQLKIKRINENREVFEEMYYYCLTHCSNTKYIEYLTEKRGLSRKQIENSKIFFIDNYNQVNNHLKKYFEKDPDKLRHCGLFNEKGNLIFYNHRLIIPYQFRTKIVYLRARYFDQQNNYQTDQFKYIGLINDSLNVNTPKRFFNIDILDKMIEGQTLYLTEGEFDCLRLSDEGYNSMAIPGSGNLPGISKFMKLSAFKIIVVPDNDAAGSKMIDGKYFDKHGNEKYSEHNLTEYFDLIKKEFFIKKLPDNVKDITEFFQMAS